MLFISRTHPAPDTCTYTLAIYTRTYITCYQLAPAPIGSLCFLWGMGLDSSTVENLGSSVSKVARKTLCRPRYHHTIKSG